MANDIVEIKNYLTLSRGFFAHPFWSEKRVFSRAEAWLDLIRESRFVETTNKQVIGNELLEWGRGQLPASIRYLATRWDWGTKKVGNFLDFLIEEEMISISRKNATATTIITLCKYDSYNPTSEKRQQQGNNGATIRQQRGNKSNIENIENIEKGEAPPPTLPLQIEKSKLELDFENFNSWLEKNAPQVLKMKEPFTLKQFQKITTDFSSPDLKELMKHKLKAMHNRPDLTKKYTNANLTLREWMKMGERYRPEAPVIEISAKGKNARELQDEQLLNEIHGLNKFKQG